MLFKVSDPKTHYQTKITADNRIQSKNSNLKIKAMAIKKKEFSKAR